MNHVSKVLTWLALALTLFCSAALADDGARVGVYYFPGWRDHAEPSRAFPWDAIKRFPERQPLQGWYVEGDDAVTRRQLDQMREFGIGYVIYDWYWGTNDRARLDHALRSYQRTAKTGDPRFSLMWANHNKVPTSAEQFDRLVDLWVNSYFGDPRYERIDGRPLFIVFSPEQLQRSAKSFNADAAQLIAKLREVSRARLGLDPFIVGVTHAVEKRVNDQYLKHGYDAYTGYNYQYGVEGVFKGAKYSRSYDELVDGYSRTWQWMLKHSRLPYIVPVTSGWDRRPWGGSKDPLHDESRGSPDVFARHVRSANTLVMQAPDRSLGRIHVCCWNEYGEGSYIEPTAGHGNRFLEALRDGVRP